MTATQSPPRRPVSHRVPKAASRPVRDVLLEITYRLHATKVVGRLPAPAGAGERP